MSPCGGTCFCETDLIQHCSLWSMSFALLCVLQADAVRLRAVMNVISGGL